MLSNYKYYRLSDQQWVRHNLQNSFQYEQDSDEIKQNNKGQQLPNIYNFDLRKIMMMVMNQKIQNSK
ncbi:unnamed protein product [Paramecium sonneborni]|uniref:Uncharacterized protein n=1 Tax=Paramecium sonneborni TaxID=65129 RepID=A0A8S1MFQ4_9CILI|nr:unnamed protein product [Paramecium sonneborni]